MSAAAALIADLPFAASSWLVTGLQDARTEEPVATALHWWEGQFYCEFLDDRDDGLLRMFANGELVWEQPVISAATAFRRASEIIMSLPWPGIERRQSSP